MPTQTIQSGADTWARQKYPAKTHGAQDFLAIQADPGTGDECQAFIWIRCPAIVGDNVSSAQLVLTASNAGPGQTFTGERITSSWKQKTLCWGDGRPNVTATGSTTTTVGSVAVGDQVTLDVTSIYQSAAGGAKFWGIRLTTSESSQLQRFYSLNSDSPPALVIEYNKPASAPTALVPAGVVGEAAPVVACDYTDTTGHSGISQINIQCDPAANGTSPAFDSGWVDVESPELDLSTTTFTPLASGSSTQWRVRVQGDSGISDWSDWVTMTYQAQPTLTITNPSAGAVGSPTFDATATLSTTASAWRIRITAANDRTDVLYDSGKRTSSVIAVQIPEKYRGSRIVAKDGTSYQIAVRAWDTVANRVATPGSPTFVEQWATFSLVDDDSTPPDSVTATVFEQTPIVQLQWHRATEPDGWVIHRDGDLIANLDISDVVSVGGGVYQWNDVGASPLNAHTWKVKAVTDGSSSAAGSSGSVALQPVGGVWIIALDGSAYVCVRDATVAGAVNTDQGATYQTVGSRAPFRIVTALTGRSYQGVQGRLKEGIAGRTRDQWRADALTIKATPTTNVRLVQDDENLLVQVANVTVTADDTSTPARPVSAIRFDYQQVGEFEYGGRI